MSVNRNNDDAAIAGLANGEDYTINTGAVLTINSDSRWGQQAAVIGNITIDAATGGRLTIDGTEVWWIPFDGGTGNVPALGTVDTDDVTGDVAGTGEFLGIFTALGVAPTAAAAAMPATGFLKLRRKTADFADNEVITLAGGATVTVNSATGGQRGWLHIVGEEGTTITVPRLGIFEALGDWFELGETNGADDQTFQYYVADVCPAIQVETGVGTGIYEWWPCAGSRWAQANLRVATDARGKFFGCPSTGVITIATRVGNDSGFKPVSGCKVRVPNIHFSNSNTAGSFLTNVISTTLSSRWDFTTTSAGDITFDKCNLNIYASLTQAFSTDFTDVGINGAFLISECASVVNLTRVCVGISANTDFVPFTMSSCFAGAVLTDCNFTRYESETGDTGSTITDCDNVTIDGGIYRIFGDNTAGTLSRGSNAARGLTLTRVTNSVLDNIIVQGAGLGLVECVNIEINNLTFGAQIEGQATNSTQPVSAIDISLGSNNIFIDGYGGNFAGIANTHPYNAIVAIVNSFNCTVQNIGTPASPFDCGSANACAGIVAFSGNSSRNKIRRCYCSNARTGPWTDINSDSKNSFINVWGDGADTGSVANGLGGTIRGVRCTNPTTGATAVYGTHFYDTFVSTTEARLVLLGNEPDVNSGTKLAITAGTPVFTSVGTCLLRTAGDQITYEMDYFCRGWTSFSNANPTFSGTNPDNHRIEYQIDTGSGYSGWRNLRYLRATGGGTSGTFVITMADTTGVAVGDRVFGTNVGTNAEVVSIDSSTNITVTVVNAGTVSGTLTFRRLHTETINATTGFKLKVRITCVTTATGNILINERITGVTDATSYQTQYPLITVPVSVVALAAADSTEIEDARVLLRSTAGSTVTITRASSTATVAHTAHGYISGKKVVIAGANEGEYNGVKTITVVDANSYTYTVSGTPATPATGTITSYRVILEGLTDSIGEISDPEVELIGSTLAVSGVARKGTAAPYYKASPIAGTITEDGLALTVYLVGDN